MLCFSDRIKTIRTHLLGITRVEFSKRFDIPEVTLRAWETGRTEPTTSSLDKLIKNFRRRNLQIEKEWLFSGKGFPPISPSNHVFGALNDESFLPSLKKNDIVINIQGDSYEPKYPKDCNIGAIHYDQPFENHTDVIVSDKNKKTSIMKLVLDVFEKPILVPLNKEKDSRAISDISQISIYKIVWIAL